MKKQAKSSMMVCILLICLLFACSLGFTFATIILNLKMGSNPNSTSAYMARQQYTVVNDTLNSPILFGHVEANFEVKIKYSYSYNFDVRVKYSLSWANSKNTNTENVILLFADRDNYVVDNSYVYYAKSVQAGDGSLSIFTGVNFADLNDESYAGGLLTINIEEVKIYRALNSAGNYTTSHPLYTNTDAGNGWLNIKNPSLITDSAYAMVYNYRYDIDHGISYPGVETAYRKAYADPNDSQSQNMATWLGGNKYYAGVGVYIVTGAEDLYIKARLIGSWRSKTSSDTDVWDNNIRYNFAENWINTNEFTDSTFDRYYYNYKIPAYSHVYIEILDSIEITALGGQVLSADYLANFRMVTNIEINTETPLSMSDGIEATFIPQPKSTTELVAKGLKNYTPSDLTINNNSVWQNGLYKVNTGTVSQTFLTNLSLTNNTLQDYTANISYQLKYYISNGMTTLYKGDGTPDFSNGTDWVSLNELLSASYINSTLPTQLVIPAMSTKVIANEIEIGASLGSYIINKYKKEDQLNVDSYYDVWLELVPKITTTTTTANNLAIETSVSNGIVTLSLKNKSSSSVSNIQISNLTFRQLTQNYQLVGSNSEPTDWFSNYWEYYYSEGGSYHKYTTAYNDGSTTYSPTQTYALTKVVGLLSGVTLTLKNGFTGSAGNYSANVTLRPNEKLEFATFATNANLVSVNYSISATGSQAGFVDMVNEGTSNAYIQNSTTNSYYVRFKGTLSSNLNNFVKLSDGYTYYVGVVYAGQQISVPMSDATNFTFEFIQIENNGIFNKNTISAWGEEIQSIFETYFSLS